MLNPLTPAEREELFGSPTFTRIDGNKLAMEKEWKEQNIKPVVIPQLVGTPTYGGYIRSGKVKCNVKIHAQLKALFVALKERDLMGYIIFWGGSFSIRYKRGSIKYVSNHSYGIAFDINPSQNKNGQLPAKRGAKGSVKEIVRTFEEFGFIWYGPYLDGMHFEFHHFVDLNQVKKDGFWESIKSFCKI